MVYVALPASAWIETPFNPALTWTIARSHSPRVRGLKQFWFNYVGNGWKVALPASAWIETTNFPSDVGNLWCRTPRECVD